MRRNQKLTNNDYEIALFPMEYLRITQGRYSNFSHKGYNAYDLGGKDYNIDDVLAPFTLKVEWVDNGKHKTGVVVSNAKKILLANGNIQAPRTVLMMLWHANDIRHLKQGQIITQGTPFYKEGTAGISYGNHVHLELAYGVYSGGYPLYLLGNGYWTLKGQELNIEDAFYINDTVVRNTLGYNFKTYVAPTKPKPAKKTIEQMAQEVHHGDHGKGHANRQKSLGITKAEYEKVRAEVNRIIDKGNKPTPAPKPTPKKEKWLRIPTTVTSYSYYKPNQRNKVVSNRWGVLRPHHYASHRYLEYKVIEEKGNFKTIQLNGNKKNPLIDIFTGKGTEHAWEIFYK